MADDLSTSRPRRLSDFGKRFSLLSALLYIATAAALIAGVYVLVVDDPLGGEPVAVAPIEGTPAPSIPAADDVPIRRSLDEPADEARFTSPAAAPGDVVITEPGGTPVGTTGAMPELIEPSRHGPLPMISQDGRRPAEAYAGAAAPIDADVPRIAILVGGMGLSATVTEDAIRRLPQAVTLAFAPYGREIDRLTARARANGHELMLQVPLEPYDYPDNDPGPHTLLTGLSAEQNRDRLHWVMSRFTGYVGVTNYMGGRFRSAEGALRPFLGELRERGLIYADDASSPRSLAGQVARNMGLAFVAGDVVIDATPTRAAIAEALDELEAVALERGKAFGIATGLPAGIEEIAAWAQTLESRGIVLVPVTALLREEG